MNRVILTTEDLKELVHSDLSRQNVLLLALGAGTNGSKTVKEIVEHCNVAGIEGAVGWNVSQTLTRTKGLAIRVGGRWELSRRGWSYVNGILKSIKPGTPLVTSAESLRKEVALVSNASTRAFIEEAIGCLEAGLLRAAVVFSWIGAVAVLQENVLERYLSRFNDEARRRDSKWKPAKNADDLARMKEYEFLMVLEAISVLGKNVRQSLQRSLELRNACGHPSSLKLGEHIVAAHLELLILNVFARFH